MTEHCGTSEAARLLGLSVGTVQSLVEQGELSAWKTPGGHRRIYLESIERYRQRHGNTPPASVSAPAKAPAAAPASVLTVLVVEDEEVTLAVMKAAFEKWHLPIDCVFMNSGVKALLEIGALRPNLLITDLNMPGVDGFDLVATLDRDPSFSSLLIVALTALAPDEIQRRGGLPERVQVMPKPVSLPWLNGYISALVAQRRLTDASQQPAAASAVRVG